ncbi:hypothetical protein PV08_07397 [Exophiala spinifera]|uniref:Peptidase S26 domain-containing protein n=1 Tax=Exophiala spinifera TaxID=91928 RepID=A0A0D2B6T9_9EURO|nr:uncharacterized protein PV08_07397 [Exophiala spinifera]KIW14613.1 hypothetical protein PV08_07397 [Exophiala spinifera]
MPPTSRGAFLVLRLIRHASSASTINTRTAHTRTLPPLPSLPTPKRTPQFKTPSRIHAESQPSNPRPSIFQVLRSPTTRRLVWYLVFVVPPVAFFLSQFPLRIATVRGPSMQPYLNPTHSPDLPEPAPDRILLQKVTFPGRPSVVFNNPPFQLHRGQIVIFYAPHDPKKWAIKRIVAVPGDRVTPRPSYPGGDGPVVVPYNHIWVEGDADGRDKTVDSNWYGPISQNLVIGVAKAAWTPWSWPWQWRGLGNWTDHDYPAKRQGRVEEDVVGEAKVDPDKVHMGQAFADGTAARELIALQAKRQRLPEMMADRKKLDKLRTIYTYAKLELEENNPESVDVAQALVDELETAFKSVGLHEDGSEIPPIPYAIQEEESKRKEFEKYLDKQRAKGAISASSPTDLSTA